MLYLCTNVREVRVILCRHYNIVADGSTHAKKDTILSNVYCWQLHAGSYGDIQYQQPLKYVLPDEVEMPDNICRIVAEAPLPHNCCLP